MKPPVVIAIISSATAIFVAIISIIYNSKNQKRSSIELEKVKLLLDIERKNIDERRRDKNEIIQAIDLALESSQKIKDNISILANSIKLKNKLTVESLKNNRQEIVNYSDTFSKVFSKLDDAERHMLHDMKQHLYQLDFVLAKLIHQKNELKNMDEQQLLKTIMNTRGLLTELQHEMLVRKSNYLQ